MSSETCCWDLLTLSCNVSLRLSRLLCRICKYEGILCKDFLKAWSISESFYALLYYSPLRIKIRNWKLIGHNQKTYWIHRKDPTGLEHSRDLKAKASQNYVKVTIETEALNVDVVNKQMSIMKWVEHNLTSNNYEEQEVQMVCSYVRMFAG